MIQLKSKYQSKFLSYMYPKIWDYYKVIARIRFSVWIYNPWLSWLEKTSSASSDYKKNKNSIFILLLSNLTKVPVSN